MRGFFRLAGMTLTDTQAAWQRLRARLPHPHERWLLLVAAVILSTLAAWTMGRLLAPIAPPATGDPAAEMMALMRRQLEERPLAFTAIQFLWLVFAIGAVTMIGRLFGGRARFDEVVLAAGWMKALLLVVQLAQLAVMTLSMGLAAMLALVESVLYLFLAVRLTQVVHGFSSPARVALAMLACFFLILFAVALRLTVFGLVPTEV